jgi:hypothetical protein
LTYMSIRDEINFRIAEGRLSELLPSVTGDPVRRHMFVSTEIRRFLEGPWPSQRASNRGFVLRAELEAFVRGDQIAICLEPYKDLSRTLQGRKGGHGPAKQAR